MNRFTQVLWSFFLLGLISFAHATPRMEGRFIQLQNTYTTPIWTQINFQQVYDTPPAVFMLSTNQGGNPAIIRIRNVTTTGFEALPLEPSGEDGEHITMGAHYFAIATGVHTFDDGTVMEVGNVEINNLQYGNTNYGGGDDFDIGRSWFTLNFATTFTQRPTFFHSLQTINNLDSIVPQTALVPFYTVAVRSNSLNTTSVDIALEASETIKGSNSDDEKIAYMVVEPGSNRTFSDDDGNTVTWETFFSGKVIDGWADGCNRVRFNNNYNASPLVAASKVSRDGADGGWLRSCFLNPVFLGLVVDEDRSWDSERNHTFEEASILAMDKSLFVYSGVFPACDALFPGALATYTSSEVVPPNVGTIELNGNIEVTDLNGAVLTTRNLQTTGVPLCNGGSCTQSSQDAISAISANLIPSINNDGSTTTLPLTLSGDYFIKQSLVQMIGSYHVIAPTRIYIQEQVVGIKPLLQMVFANITVDPAASLTIYIDGNVSITPNSITEGFIIATGEVILGSGVQHNGRITTGRLIRADNTLAPTRIDATSGAALPNYIKGICGSEVVEVIDHYRFEVSNNQALTCEAKTFNIKACANADCSMLYSQNASLDLSPDNSSQYTWAPSENIDFIGQIEVSLARASARNNVVLSYNSATPSAPLQCYINGNLVTGDCRINYFDTGFIITDAQNNPIDDQVAAVDFTAMLRAVRKNTTTGVCEDIFTGPQTVKFNTGFIAPNTHSGAINMRMSINDTMIDGLTDVAVDFDAADNHRAELKVNYPDVGEINIFAQKQVDTDAVLEGTSNNFVVRPEEFVISLEDTHQPTSPSYAEDANDSVFKQAGEDFDITITAVNKNGDTTLNFRQAEIVNNVSGFVLSHQLQAPDPLNSDAGALTVSAVNFNSGVANVSAHFSEVGIIELVAQLPIFDYLNHSGTGNLDANLQNVGRFIPASFEMTNNTAVSGCNVFTYLSQPFSQLRYDITALNLQGAQTRNYTYSAISESNFARSNVINLIENDSVDAAAYLSSTVLATRYGLSESQWLQGRYSVNVNDALLEKDYAALLVGALPEAPLMDIYPMVKLEDLDGKALQGLDQHANQFGGVPDSKAIAGPFEFRFGRLTLLNNHGSEQEPLQIPMRTEYWDGTNFALNRLDSCTAYFGSNLNVVSAHPIQGSDGQLLQGIYKPSEGWYLSAPNSAASFEVFYDSPAPWLQHDWDGNGSYNDPNDDPSATFQFGRFRGNERVIYWQETN